MLTYEDPRHKSEQTDGQSGYYGEYEKEEVFSGYSSHWLPDSVHSVLSYPLSRSRQSVLDRSGVVCGALQL